MYTELQRIALTQAAGFRRFQNPVPSIVVGPGL